MAELALQAIRTAVLICDYRFIDLPVLALLLWVNVQIGLPSEIMPVMCINAVFLLVAACWIRAPDSLIVEVVEIDVSFVFTDKINGHLTFWVSKRAVLAVITLSIEAHGAKLRSVFVWVVKFLYSCVAVYAGITLRALLLLGNIATQFWCVGTRGSASIFEFIVIVWAEFLVMARLAVAAYFYLVSV